MTRPSQSPAEAYLIELADSLPRGRAARNLLAEVRDHLYEAAAVREASGSAREAAEREAVREVGTVAELAPEFRTTAVVCDARRQANRQLVGALVLVTWGASVLHLLPGIHDESARLGPPLSVTFFHAATGTLLCASLMLLGFSGTSWPWRSARWLAWLVRSRRLAGWLFQLGLPLSAAMVAHPVGLASGSPHLWLMAGALGGHLVAGVLEPVSGACRRVGAAARPR